MLIGRWVFTPNVWASAGLLLFELGFRLKILTEPGSPLPRILLVDDNQDDVLLIMRAFQRAGLSHPIDCVSGGNEAINYLNGEHPYDDRRKYPLPELVLLDIKMPAIDGFDVLRWIRSRPQYRRLCVVMLTSSDEIRDVNLAYQLGANSFLVKPLDFWNAADLSRSIGNLLAKESGKPRQS
jgi:CheY-like chemotaxis protein